MKQIILKWVTGLIGFVSIILFPTCTDNHFDVEEGGDGLNNNASLTLWQQIEANPELSKFASILEQTPVFKDETRPIAGYTFKDLLNSDQILTVFAPTNDAFTDADMLKYEKLLKTRPYDVFLMLVGNHIARNNYVATGTGIDKLMLVNNKRATFDRQQHKLKELTLKDVNIPATNGTLHTLTAQSPFAYNIYEYIRAREDEYPELNKWFLAHRDTIFNEAASATFGSNPETGEPIYVDSVYFVSNTLFNNTYAKSQDWVMVHKGFGANLETEDSIWVMILPTNQVWNDMINKLTPYYHYGKQYIDMAKVDELLVDNAATKEAKKYMIRTIPDTLIKDAIAMDLVSPLAFNVRTQPRSINGHPEMPWTAEEFMSSKMTKIFNTRLDTFTVGEKVKTTVASEDVKALLFGNSTPIEVSNGWIYPVESWNFMDTYGAKDVEVKVNTKSIFQLGRYNLTEAQKKEKDLKGQLKYTAENNVSFQTFINHKSNLVNKYLRGTVSDDYFFYVSNGTQSSSITLKLTDYERDQQVMSGVDYEIGLVMVPKYYGYNPSYIFDPSKEKREDWEYNPQDLPIKFNPDGSFFIDEYDPDGSLFKTYCKKDTIEIAFTYTDENGKEITTAKANRYYLHYAGEKVDTVWAHKKDQDVNGTISFPVSYKNLRYSYPTITITALYNTTIQKKGFQPDFCIDRIILRAKKD